MNPRIPVTIHLSGEAFRELEAIAQRKGTSMRELIASSVERSIQRRPTRTAGQVPSPSRNGHDRGYRKLDAEEWAELKHLSMLGWSVAELATKYGCSSSAIYFRLRREGR